MSARVRYHQRWRAVTLNEMARENTVVKARYVTYQVLLLLFLVQGQQQQHVLEYVLNSNGVHNVNGQTISIS